MKPICVVGSINVDLITRVNRFPVAGETIRGNSFGIFRGGKGANQAVALARLGAKVSMIAAVGEDSFGSDYLAHLKKSGIGTAGVECREKCTTGTASIEVMESSGENHIIIVGGANDKVDPAFIEARAELIQESSFLLLQLELSLDAAIAAAEIAWKAHVPVMLDPAPACELPARLLSRCSVITPNEVEIAVLTNTEVCEEEDVRKAAARLLDQGVESVVVKLGSRGSFVKSRDREAFIPAFSVNAVDTVGAGDSMNAGLAFALARGDTLEDAARFANAVAALSTTRIGAQEAMPSLAEVKALLGD